MDFAPTDTFLSVFGRDLTSLGIVTLEDALRALGGGANALARHATASLLNASNPDVNAEASFDTTADVIAAFQAAFDSGDYEPTEDAFEENNEAGCPLELAGRPLFQLPGAVQASAWAAPRLWVRPGPRATKR